MREGRTRVTVYQQGGEPRPTPAAAELIDRVLCFGDAMPGRVVAPYSVLLGDYYQLSPRADHGQLSPRAVPTVDLAPARRALSRAARIRDEILTQLEDIDYYVSHRSSSSRSPKPPGPRSRKPTGRWPDNSTT